VLSIAYSQVVLLLLEVEIITNMRSFLEQCQSNAATYMSVAFVASCLTLGVRRSIKEAKSVATEKLEIYIENKAE